MLSVKSKSSRRFNHQEVWVFNERFKKLKQEELGVSSVIYYIHISAHIPISIASGQLLQQYGTMASTNFDKMPRKLWEHPDPKSTVMWRFMQEANKKFNLNMQVSKSFEASPILA